MSKPPDSPERFSLSRWSRRKHEVAREKAAPTAPTAAPAEAPQVVAPAAATPTPAPAEPLPPVESLTIDSDFRAFLAPEVDEDTKRAALKKLFSDPHFNVMDGLDIYIDDYSKPDPMPEGMLAKLADVYNKLAEEGVAEAEAASEGAASTAATEEDVPATTAQEETPPSEDAPDDKRTT